MLRTFSSKVIYQGSLDKGVDIVGGLTAVMKQHNIAAGVVSGIGAVSGARLGYFNARTRAYETMHFQENMEIVSLKGNISLKENGIFPHLHAVLSRKDFSVVGGHLFAATVYAFEFEIIPFEEEPFKRGFDEGTGLFLWKE
jgi:predicted DNA-binding protein with PD1-like motif